MTAASVWGSDAQLCSAGTWTFQTSGFDISVTHGDIQSGATTQTLPCSGASANGTSMIDGSGTPGYSLTCTIGVISLSGFSCKFSVAAAPANGTQPTPMPTPTSMQTCLDVKKAFQTAGCCGNPTKSFTMPDAGKRRLTSSTPLAELVDSVKAVLDQAKVEGGASKAKSLADELLNFVKENTP